jgi:hypothetical protein
MPLEGEKEVKSIKIKKSKRLSCNYAYDGVGTAWF